MTDISTIIAELRKLEKKATRAEWRAVNAGDKSCVIAQDVDKPLSVDDSMVVVCNLNKPDENAALIAASRNALPLLLDYIAKLEAVADAARNLEAAASRVRDEHMRPRKERTGTVRILTPVIDEMRKALDA